MHAVAWRTLRSASRSRSPARIVSGRRYPLPPRNRHFSTTSPAAQTSTPPTDPQTPTVERDGEPEKDREPAAAAAPEDASQDAAKSEDPDIIAKKLQKAKESVRHYGSALKRSQRHNRSQDLPPIHLPRWFLRRNVVLSEEHTWGMEEVKHLRKILSRCSLTVTDKRTGELYADFTFSTPSLRIFNVLYDITAPWRSIAAGTRPEAIGAETKQKIRNLVESLEKEAGVISKDTDFSTTGGYERGFKNAWDISEKYIQQCQDKFKKWNKFSHFDAVADLHYSVEAEIKATIAGCLLTVQPETGLSFPSAKTNLLLHSPAEGSEQFLFAVVQSMATEFGADIVTIDAQDLAELAGGYVGDSPDPMSQSIRSLGYDTYRMKSDLQESMEFIEENEEGQEEDDAPESSPPTLGFPTGKPFSSGKGNMIPGPVHIIDIQGLTKSPIFKALTSAGIGGGRERGIFTPAPGSPRAPSQSEAQWEDVKLNALLEALVDANDIKRSRPSVKKVVRKSKDSPNFQAGAPFFFDSATLQDQKAQQSSVEQHTKVTKDEVSTEVNSDTPKSSNPRSPFEVDLKSAPTQLSSIPGRKIIHIKDMKELGGTQRGSQILVKLQEIVRKRRSEGENTMIIGTTSSTDLMPEYSKAGVRSLQADRENPESYSRTIVVPFFRDTAGQKRMLAGPFVPAKKEAKASNWAETSRTMDINLRHIQDMLRSLDPVASHDLADPEHRIKLPFRTSEPNVYQDRVLFFDEVHRIALTAIGIHRSKADGSQLSAAHVSLAIQLLDSSDEAKFYWVASENKIRAKDGKESKESTGPTAQQADSKHDLIKAKANKHEKRLLGGVIDPEKINTTFSDVHAPTETIESLRMLTSLSLLRPEAFKYGVLATDKIPGLLLYGPPGTGKTLLAKAVAKESGATVLEVSGSEVYDMYVGEGEKNVRAIFSLARKLSPCVVFIDEADAIFGSRDGGRQRTSHREIINQFLKEWDGMNDLSVFIMVATNRPFDLDDAVLRRLPRRLLVDLPTQLDRKKILNIHLKGEALAKDVDVTELSELTPLYSGSDLKNLAVAAALACVREENEQAAIAMAKSMSESTSEPSTDASPEPPSSDSDRPPQLVPGLKYHFPEKRILHKRHFEKAMQEISASISEDMSSLGAIKKFDEQFGDRRGRKKKKSAYGFGMERGADEGAARVRRD
ncbi:AAA-domain-containing protein [Mytilinidion resinicola]|uniref:AAA-domain-containing protein n=1 Tax=Mytilinidion resinicola TaxID=574789 RepID=A0A6A6Y3R4_9PEZI|nr:AAA-domain-containing protein [Mytilinidion resinicola]KAF2803476.1 AAA-domain-containing protein [Mytilinidion resinicola]